MIKLSINNNKVFILMMLGAYLYGLSTVELFRYSIYDSNRGEIRILSIKNENEQTIEHIFDNIGDIISENSVN